MSLVTSSIYKNEFDIFFILFETSCLRLFFSFRSSLIVKLMKVFKVNRSVFDELYIIYYSLGY